MDDTVHFFLFASDIKHAFLTQISIVCVQEGDI